MVKQIIQGFQFFWNKIMKSEVCIYKSTKLSLLYSCRPFEISTSFEKYLLFLWRKSVQVQVLRWRTLFENQFDTYSQLDLGLGFYYSILTHQNHLRVRNTELLFSIFKFLSPNRNCGHYKPSTWLKVSKIKAAGKTPKTNEYSLLKTIL